MKQVGYKLIDQQGGTVQEWGGIWGQCPGTPDVVTLPNGDRVHCPELGTEYGGCTLVPWMMEEPVSQVVVPTQEELAQTILNLQKQLEDLSKVLAPPAEVVSPQEPSGAA